MRFALLKFAAIAPSRRIRAISLHNSAACPLNPGVLDTPESQSKASVLLAGALCRDFASPPPPGLNSESIELDGTPAELNLDGRIFTTAATAR
jgi:hypothetical protein